MARPFIMLKNVNGIEYAYLYKDVKNEDGRHQAELVRYLGRLDILLEALNSVLIRRGKGPLPRISKREKRSK
jgi:hypothetical protein